MGRMYRRITMMLLFVVICQHCLACTSAEIFKYYSDKENYLSATGTITHISYSEEQEAMYIEFSELSPTFDDTCFKIVGENYRIVQNNGINELIKVGTKTSFITAPQYYGDGYIMPIVSISVDNVVLLEFDDGYANLLRWIRAG